MVVKNEMKMKQIEKIELKEPVAIVGSSGLRSVGKIAIDYLIEKMKPKLITELYSHSFPVTYYGPSYICAPCAMGVKVERGVAELPKIEFYAMLKENVLITRGYQAYNTMSQYMIADKVTDLFKEFNVKKIYSLGAQTLEKGVRSCVTDFELLEELRKYGIEKSNVDRFIGFSGLIAGVGRIKGIKGICLFATTTQNSANPEYPDFNAAKELLEKLSRVLGIKIDLADLELEEWKRGKKGKGKMEEERRRKEKEREEKEELKGYI